MQNYPWKKQWARHTGDALSGIILQKNPQESLSLAKAAVGNPDASADAVAIYLILLQINGLVREAHTYLQSNVTAIPNGENFLLCVMAEIEITAGNWQQAYRLATAVLSSDTDNFRALVSSSIANFGAGNTHEALGNALRANRIRNGAPPAVLQIMRCQNALGNYYAAIAAFDELDAGTARSADSYVELGAAYAALENNPQAVAAYEKALASGQRTIEALRGLITLYVNTGASTALEALAQRYPAQTSNDTECTFSLALERLRQRDTEGCRTLLTTAFEFAQQHGAALNELSWPVPEPHIRHEYEQLETLNRRGKLAGSGLQALPVLKQYCDQPADSSKTFAPADADAQALRDALTLIHHYPDAPFADKALGDTDYSALEETFLTKTPAVLVIDNFLSPAALAALREYCEEATIWRAYNEGGYVAAMLGTGFNPRVLLAIVDELRQSMPKVIGAHPLLQAWAFKYDHRLRGTHVHADFAKVNVNFWITPDEACADNTRGGLIVYDRVAPRNWTFADYNADPGRMHAFLKAHDVKSRRIPYRANRCVLFDSRLFHATDDIRFKPGYTNRRINVTLLYGNGSAVD